LSASPSDTRVLGVVALGLAAAASCVARADGGCAAAWAVAWAAYYSVKRLGGPFFTLQWDTLLLEVFNACDLCCFSARAFITDFGVCCAWGECCCASAAIAVVTALPRPDVCAFAPTFVRLRVRRARFRVGGDATLAAHHGA
jgi:hypothetical protein